MGKPVIFLCLFTNFSLIFQLCRDSLESLFVVKHKAQLRKETQRGFFLIFLCIPHTWQQPAMQSLQNISAWRPLSVALVANNIIS